jgi:hypothetical protein
MKYVVFHPYSFRKFHPDYHEKLHERKLKEKKLTLTRSLTESFSKSMVGLGFKTGINDDQEPDTVEHSNVNYLNDDEYINFHDHRDDGLYIRVFYAFFLGFF